MLDAGGQVVLYGYQPNGRSGSQCVGFWRLITRGVRDCLTFLRSRGRVPYEAGMIATATQNARVMFVDPQRFSCGKRSCSQLRHGLLAYRDGGHLSVDGSLGLADDLDEVLDRLLVDAAR